MDSVTISRRNPPNYKGNKENTQPPTGTGYFIKTGKTSVPFQLRGNKEDALTKDSHLGKSKQVNRKPGPEEAQRKLQRDAKVVSSNIKAQTLKPAVAEAPKLSSKSAPGMYKGRIVQSKIGSFWKTSGFLSAASKPQASKPQSEKPSDMAKRSRSKSVADVSRQAARMPAPKMSKFVSDKPSQVTRSTVCNGFPAWPPTRTLTGTSHTATSKISTVVPLKPRGDQNTKLKIPVTDKKASKPVVSSTLSQYSVAMETAEEKRAKLAEWLASKGKTLKRPAMASIAPRKTKVSEKVKVDSKVPEKVELQSVQCKDELNPCLKAHNLEHEILVETQGGKIRVQSQTPGIMETLDLLEDSEADQSTEPLGTVDDIVVNLCDALETMVTPSRSSEHKDQQIQVEEIKEESEVMDQKVKQEDIEESGDYVKALENSDNDMEPVPQTGASVIRYSVKTTPYLQSVKKTIEDKVSTNKSTKKSNIKDLKFLTPVRRSSRIQRKSFHLPSMITDHDPCVSSLAELVQLDDDPNAYIYRKNPALL